MAILAVQEINPAALTPVDAAAAAGGDSFPNSGEEFVRVKTGGTGATVTFPAPNADNFGIVNAAHDVVVVMGINTERMIGPFRRDRFNDASGRVNITYSQVATVTVAVLKRT